jgi:hypothetical protein
MASPGAERGHGSRASFVGAFEFRVRPFFRPPEILETLPARGRNALRPYPRPSRARRRSWNILAAGWRWADLARVPEAVRRRLDLLAG